MPGISQMSSQFRNLGRWALLWANLLCKGPPAVCGLRLSYLHNHLCFLPHCLPCLHFPGGTFILRKRGFLSSTFNQRQHYCQRSYWDRVQIKYCFQLHYCKHILKHKEKSSNRNSKQLEFWQLACSLITNRTTIISVVNLDAAYFIGFKVLP